MEYSKTYNTLHDLGHNIVRAEARRNSGTITIIAPSTAEEQSFVPAVDVCIYGIDKLKLLRDVLDTVITKATEHETKT